MNRRRWALALGLLLLLLLGGLWRMRPWPVGWREWPSLFPEAAESARPAPLHHLPDFQLPDLDGRQRSSRAWAGKVVVLNFWATWCPPCLRELPILDAAQQQYPDLQVVGIAIDDPEEVRRFLAEHPVRYPVLLGDVAAIDLSRRLGNRLQGLPFTAVFDRDGHRVQARIGEVTARFLEEFLPPRLPDVESK